MKIFDYNGRRNICSVRIRQARKNLYMSQHKVAVQLQLEGLSLAGKGVSRIESGARFIADYELKILAKVLHYGFLGKMILTNNLTNFPRKNMVKRRTKEKPCKSFKTKEVQGFSKYWHLV